MNFWRISGPTQRKRSETATRKSALMGIRFGLQRHFLLKGEFDIISDGEFSKSNQIFEAAIVELKRQGFGKVDHHIPISKEDLEKIHSSYHHLLQILNPSNKWCGLILCFTSFAAAEKISDSSRRNRSSCRFICFSSAAWR